MAGLEHLGWCKAGMGRSSERIRPRGKTPKRGRGGGGGHMLAGGAPGPQVGIVKQLPSVCGMSTKQWDAAPGERPLAAAALASKM